MVKVWQTASLYHLVHTAALVAAPITKNPNIVSVVAGISEVLLLFIDSTYISQNSVLCWLIHSDEIISFMCEYVLDK